MRNIDEMKRSRKAKMDEARALSAKAATENRTLTEEEEKRFEELMAEVDKWAKEIQREERLQKLEGEGAGVTGAAGAQEGGTGPTKPVVSETPPAGGEEKRTGYVTTNEGPPRPYKTLVQQLRAIKMAAHGQVDENLRTIMNAEVRALGMNTGIGTEGAFALQTDFAGMMMETASKSGQILPLVDKYTITDGSNSVRWVEVKEDDISTTVFGGVRVYWAAEGSDVTASRPQLKERKMELEKLMGVAYATYELETNSSFANELLNRAFAEAIQRELEGAIVSGNGVGRPLGFLNSKNGSLIAVDEEPGQEDESITWKNLSAMYHRMINKTRGVWVMHPDCHKKLDFLNFPIGTGGVPVYLPATQLGSVNTLRGRPIVESDHCSALGEQGDICYIDPSAYILAMKGGMDVATSIHVAFLTAENCFRWIFQVNGMPKVEYQLTIKNSTDKRSPFIALAARS